MDSYQLYIVDDSLINKLGHYYEYDRSIYEGVKQVGLSCCVLSNEKIENDIKAGWSVIPTFRYHTDSHLLKWNRFKPLAELINILISNTFFFFDLRKSLRNHTIGPSTLLFLPNVRQYSFFGTLLWFIMTRSSKRPRLALLFRYEYRRFTLKKMTQLANRVSADGKKIIFVTDSELLAKDYADMTGSSFQVLPIPHTLHVSKTNSEKDKQNFPVKLVSLGGPRLEKGIETLVDAIPYLGKELNENVVQFDIQVNAPKSDLALMTVIEKLVAYSKKFKGITLYHNSLSTDDYYKIVTSSDVVLLPYMKEFYYSRTSGPLTEAFALGKPVITTEGTWMSLQLQKFGAGITFSNSNAKDLARSIKELIQNLEEHKERAQQSRSVWTAKHNAQNFCFELLNLFEERLPSAKI